MARKILVASMAAVAISGTALAADLPYRGASAGLCAARPIFTWTGFYVGVNAGGSFGGSNSIITATPFLAAQPQASLTCRAIHSAVGCAVTPSQRKRLRACPRTSDP